MDKLIRTKEELLQFVNENNKTYNIYIPPQPIYRNGLALSPVIVKIETDFQENEFFNTDLWTFDKKRYVLSKNGLNKIASATGVTFPRSRMVDRIIDEETGRVTFIKHEVMWQRQTPEGILLQGTTTGEYNYYEDFAKLRYKKDVVVNGKIIKKAGEPIMEQIEQRRRFAGSLAETNAKIRGLQEAIPELPKNFTLEELKKPLILFRIVVDVSEIFKSTPELMQVYNAKLLGLADIIYAPPTTLSNQVLIQNSDKLYHESIEAPKEIKEIETKTNVEPKTDVETKTDVKNDIDEEIKKEIARTKYNGKAINIWHNFDTAKKELFLAKLKELKDA